MKSPEAKELYELAIKRHGKKIEINIGKDKDNVRGSWNPKKSLISIMPGMTQEETIGAILFEVVRARRNNEQEEFDKRARQGLVSRNDYAVYHERLSYAYFKEAENIAKKAVEGKCWKPESNVFSKDLERWYIFDKFFEHQDNPRNFPPIGGEDGPRVSHTERFRIFWDENFKEAFEAREEKKKKK
jgi:hypothetical protein